MHNFPAGTFSKTKNLLPVREDVVGFFEFVSMGGKVVYYAITLDNNFNIG
jgi:hypothetical protein